MGFSRNVARVLVGAQMGMCGAFVVISPHSRYNVCALGHTSVRHTFGERVLKDKEGLYIVNYACMCVCPFPALDLGVMRLVHSGSSSNF